MSFICRVLQRGVEILCIGEGEEEGVVAMRHKEILCIGGRHFQTLQSVEDGAIGTEILRTVGAWILALRRVCGSVCLKALERWNMAMENLMFLVNMASFSSASDWQGESLAFLTAASAAGRGEGEGKKMKANPCRRGMASA